jgi:capsular exopolysaccharide synthesis family protein
MARDVVLPSAWRIKDLKDPGPLHHPLPTMADTGEVDIRRFIRTVYRRKFLLVLTMAVSIGATVYWLSQATPRYSADVLIVIESRPSSIVRVDQVVEDVINDSAKVNTEVAVLESRGLAARVIEDLGLDQDPEFAPDAPPGGLLAKVTDSAAFRTVVTALESIRSSFISAAADDLPEGEPVQSLPPPDDRTLEEQRLDALRSAAVEETETRAVEQATLLDRFLHHLLVEPEDSSRLIRISFTSTDPAKAARIANKVVDEYIESQLETKSEGARRAADWLELRLAELGDTVRSLEESVQKQRAETGTNSIKIVDQRLAQLNSELVVAQAALAATTARYQQVQNVLSGGGRAETLPSVIASSSVQALRAKHMELTERLSDLETTFGENHPQIVALHAERSGVERSLSHEIDNILSGLRNEVNAASMHEAGLRSQLDSVSQEMVRLTEAETTIGQAAQRMNANRDLYQNLLKRHTEAKALRDNQQPDARVISPAQVPLSPSYPNVPRVIALSFVGSASLALFLLVVVERLRQRLDSVEDVERHVGMQVIGAIPDFPRLRRLTSAPGDYMQREPLSELGGAFQRLRALLTLGNDRKMPRTLLVTSGTAGEGKTTVAVCLGIASVSSGQKVLLVDCDFSRPQVHRMVDVKNERGLTDILRGTATLEETIAHAAGYSLSILTIGRSRQGAIDLLNSERMEELLAELRRIYDIVILDSAPVLEVSNALILGGLAEKTILVTRREWTTPRDASYAVEQLQLYGADIAGVVFNRTDATRR